MEKLNIEKFTPEQIKGINLYYAWTQKVVPFVYDNSLSYLENLMHMVTFLNEMLQRQNQLSSLYDSLVLYTNTSIQDQVDYINNFVSEMETNFAKFKQEMLKNQQDFENQITQDFETFKTEINNAFNAYKELINGEWEDYKENLNNEWNQEQINLENQVMNAITRLDNAIAGIGDIVISETRKQFLQLFQSGDLDTLIAENVGILVPLKSITTAPENPTTNDYYYNAETKNVYVYNGTAWEILHNQLNNFYVFNNTGYFMEYENRTISKLFKGELEDTLPLTYTYKPVLVRNQYTKILAFPIPDSQTGNELTFYIYDRENISNKVTSKITVIGKVQDIIVIETGRTYDQLYILYANGDLYGAQSWNIGNTYATLSLIRQNVHSIFSCGDNNSNNTYAQGIYVVTENSTYYVSKEGTSVVEYEYTMPLTYANQGIALFHNNSTGKYYISGATGAWYYTKEISKIPTEVSNIIFVWVADLAHMTSAETKEIYLLGKTTTGEYKTYKGVYDNVASIPTMVEYTQENNVNLEMLTHTLFMESTNEYSIFNTPLYRMKMVKGQITEQIPFNSEYNNTFDIYGVTGNQLYQNGYQPVIVTNIIGLDHLLPSASDLQALDTKVNTLQQNYRDLNNSVIQISAETTENTSDISTLKQDNTTNKSDISSLKQDNTTNKNNISNLQTRVTNLESTKHSYFEISGSIPVGKQGIVTVSTNITIPINKIESISGFIKTTNNTELEAYNQSDTSVITSLLGTLHSLYIKNNKLYADVSVDGESTTIETFIVGVNITYKG